MFSKMSGTPSLLCFVLNRNPKNVGGMGRRLPHLSNFGFTVTGHQKMLILHHGSHMKEVIDLTPHSSGDSSTEEVGFALLGPVWC